MPLIRANTTKEIQNELIAKFDIEKADDAHLKPQAVAATSNNGNGATTAPVATGTTPTAIPVTKVTPTASATGDNVVNCNRTIVQCFLCSRQNQ